MGNWKTRNCEHAKCNKLANENWLIHAYFFYCCFLLLDLQWCISLNIVIWHTDKLTNIITLCREEREKKLSNWLIFELELDVSSLNSNIRVNQAEGLIDTFSFLNICNLCNIIPVDWPRHINIKWIFASFDGALFMHCPNSVQELQVNEARKNFIWVIDTLLWKDADVDDNSVTCITIIVSYNNQCVPKIEFKVNAFNGKRNFSSIQTW